MKSKKIVSAFLCAAMSLSLTAGLATSAAAESRIYGDVNGSGEVDSADGTLMNRYLAKWDVSDKIDLNAADIDGVDGVNSADAALLNRYLAKWNIDSRIGQPIKTQKPDTVTIPNDKAEVTFNIPDKMVYGETQALDFSFSADPSITVDKVVYTYRSSNADVLDASTSAANECTLTAKNIGISTVTVTAWMTLDNGETQNVSKSMDITVINPAETLVFGSSLNIRCANDAANAYADSLVSGTNLSRTEDSQSVHEKEIILSVGKLDGVVSSGDSDLGYALKVSGEKLYVVASEKTGLDAAVRYLKKYALSENKDQLSVPKTLDCSFVAKNGHYISNLTIAGNPISDYQIVYPDIATLSIQNATDVLRRYLERASGAYPPIVKASEADPSKKQIRLLIDPTCTLTQKDGVDYVTPSGYFQPLEFGELDRCGYRIEVAEDGTVTIVGGPTAGILYGVCEFVEEFVGMRLLESGVHFYPAQYVDIPAGLAHQETPTFEYRSAGGTPNNDTTAARKINADRNDPNLGDGLGNMFWHGHSFGDQIKEYYEQKDPSRGTFEPYGLTGIGWTQPCLSNEKNYEECIRNAFAEVENRIGWMGYVLGEPGCQYLTIFYNDNENYCKCGRCMRTNRAEGSDCGTLVRFVNRVADALKDTYPQMTIYTLGYGTTARKPATTELRDNVILCYCWNGCNNHHFDGTACSESGTGGTLNFQNKDELKYYQEWTEKSSKQHAWLYTTSYGYILEPMPVTYNLHYDLLWLAENGCSGIYPESLSGGDNRGFEKAHAYLVSNLMWNAYMTEEQYQFLIEEYYRMTYGDGWRDLLELMNMWIESGDVLGCWLSNFSRPAEYTSVKYYTEHQDQMLALAESAMAKANTQHQQDIIEVIKANVVFMSLCGDYEAKFVNGSAEEKAAYQAKYDWLYNFLKTTPIQRVEVREGFAIPDTNEITANPMKMLCYVDEIYPRWP